MSHKVINMVTIGGGGGHAQVLKALRTLAGVRITAICPSTDTGGSTGQLVRDYRGRGYLGDLTKCIAALCPDRMLARALMHRFDRGALAGHSVKNILLLGLERSAGPRKALDLMHRVVGIAPHRVLPVCTETTELRATLKYGNEVRGETNIDLISQNPLWHPDAHAIRTVFLKPRVKPTATVTNAVRRADWLVVCPGDLYSSILPVLLPDGMKEAIRTSGARIIVVLNIMTKKGETHGYRAEDFLKRIEQNLGRRCDIILANSSSIPKRLALSYALERKVRLSPRSVRSDKRVKALPLLKETAAGELYHDERMLAKALGALIAGRDPDGVA